FFEPRPLDIREGDLPNATGRTDGGSEGIYNNLRNPRNDEVRPISAKELELESRLIPAPVAMMIAGPLIGVATA
ncbi:hypothetical protein THAOC_33925, partial [Thalassiosira oceanica]